MEGKNYFKTIIGAAAIVILAGTVGYYIYNDIAVTSLESEDMEEKERETVNIGGLELEVEEGANPVVREISIPIEDTADTKDFEEPDLNRPIIFPDIFPEDTRLSIS